MPGGCCGSWGELLVLCGGGAFQKKMTGRGQAEI